MQAARCSGSVRQFISSLSEARLDELKGRVYYSPNRSGGGWGKEEELKVDSKGADFYRFASVSIGAVKLPRVCLRNLFAPTLPCP